MVKRRLYRLMRTLLTANWPKYLQTVVKALNNTPNAGIGYLKPAEIQSPMDDPKVDAAIGVPEDVSPEEQKYNQAEYEIGNDLQVNDHVYLDFPPATMEKGFDSPVSKNNISCIILYTFKSSLHYPSYFLELSGVQNSTN